MFDIDLCERNNKFLELPELVRALWGSDFLNNTKEYQERVLANCPDLPDYAFGRGDYGRGASAIVGMLENGGSKEDILGCALAYARGMKNGNHTMASLREAMLPLRDNG